MREKIVYLGKKSSKKFRKVMKAMGKEEYQSMELGSRMGLIQELIPIALMKLQDDLQMEVQELAGERYERREFVRYGRNPGSVVLGEQRIGIEVPRVRDLRQGVEVPLTSYQRLHEGEKRIEAGALAKILRGISCRDYSAAVKAIPEAFGLSSSTISKKFVRASSRQLKALQERDLSEYDFVAIAIDGKTFGEDDLIVAVGITIEGRKVMLGFIEAATENEKIASEFLKGLLSRGLNIEEGILAIIDGSKGLASSIRKVFAGKALLQRCQWHKRENIVSYVSKEEQPFLRKRLQHAYDRPIYLEAKGELAKIHRELEERNLSAVASMDEGFEETLTLHRLDLFGMLGRSFKTTNCIESINAMIEQRCGKVDYWRNSSQRQRWLAATLLDTEPRLNRVKGYQYLYKLRAALKKELKIENCEALREAA